VTPLEARGAPRDQGLAQGRSLRSEVRAALARERGRYGLLAWILACGRAQRSGGREIARFLPQQHERLQGMASGAGVSTAALELLALSSRVSLSGTAQGTELSARVSGPEPWLVRRSAPDAGGFPSAELVAPGQAGCVGGVNAEGVALLCLREAPCAPPLGLLIQDALFRCPRAGAALDHVRRRAPYLRVSGSAILVDAGAEPLRLELRDGELEVGDPEPAIEHGREASEVVSLRLDASSRTLIVRDAHGGELKVTPPEAF
jgi:hypothetical protein